MPFPCAALASCAQSARESRGLARLRGSLSQGTCPGSQVHSRGAPAVTSQKLNLGEGAHTLGSFELVKSVSSLRYVVVEGFEPLPLKHGGLKL